MKNFILLFIILFSLSISISCRKDFTTISNPGSLNFSRDTIFLDTIFSNISSSTYAVKVYNRSNDDIHIPSINLGRGTTSFYRLNVDGLPGKSFEDITLLSKDSIYIFVEATINFDELTNPIYKDSIVFESEAKQQDIKLITLVKDSRFLYATPTAFDIKQLKDNVRASDEPEEDKTRKIDSISKLHEIEDMLGGLAPKRTLTTEELHFTNEKSYVIYDYCIVPENETLIIDAGAELNFHKGAALVVSKNASIKINGTLDEKVLIEGDRLEPEFSNISGQWHGIWLQNESTENVVNHTQIRNATIGIRCDSISKKSGTPTLTIHNSEIYNTAEYGILATATFINAENLVLGGSRLNSLSIEKGGSYSFNHCTFANYWSNSFRRSSTLSISNADDNDEDNSTKNLTQALFTNCIIDGANTNEVSLATNERDQFSFFFDHCMIKYKTTENQSPLYDFTDSNFYNKIIENEDAFFQLNQNDIVKETGVHKFRIGEESAAIEKANTTGANNTPLDLLGVDRTSKPDLGAYQHITFEKQEEEEN